MGTFFPEAWRSFAEALPESERSDLLGNYHLRLTHPDPAIHMPAAAAWSRYETVCSNLIPRPEEPSASFGGDSAALALARIEAHYFVNDVFLEDGELLNNVRQAATHPFDPHPGPLRHGVSDRHRRHAGAGLAGSEVRDRSRTPATRRWNRGSAPLWSAPPRR